MNRIPFIVAILWSVVGFAFYHFLSLNQSLAGKIWRSHTGLDPRVKMVVLQRVWGVLFLGIISWGLELLFMDGSAKACGLSFSFTGTLPWWSYLVFPLILLLSYLSASTPSNLALYPQIRVENWSLRILLISTVSWMAFLVAYEFLFRGFLLFATLQVLDPWMAIALNCSLYAFAHFYKGPRETFGAIPAGILLCYLTLQTGNIWSAVIIHSVMALSNEWFSLRAHPQMNLFRK
jgi:membrane protease YdiL (CAAX protease family)